MKWRLLKNKMSKFKKADIDQLLFNDVSKLIDEARQYVAQSVNTTLALLYWKIGKRINSEVLKNKRALSPQCRDFFRRINCLRSAETIGVDALQ